MISCMEEKMFDAQDDAHLSNVLSYPVHRRLASKRKWKITRMEQKKKDIIDARPRAHFSGATCHTLPSCLCSTRMTTITLFAKFLLTGK